LGLVRYTNREPEIDEYPPGAEDLIQHWDRRPTHIRRIFRYRRAQRDRRRGRGRQG
jgi:hypothetical protein